MSNIYLVAIAVAAVAAGFFHIKLRDYRARKARDSATAAIVDYFAKSAATVSAQVVAVGTGRLLALIESEPLKRFRYSHIVEASLIDHVHKKTGLTIEKVYWRFPLSLRPAEGTPETTTERKVDDYVAEGLSRLKTKHDYTVVEGSWGEFEQARKPDGPPTEGSSAEDDGNRK